MGFAASRSVYEHQDPPTGTPSSGLLIGNRLPKTTGSWRVLVNGFKRRVERNVAHFCLYLGKGMAISYPWKVLVTSVTAVHVSFEK